MDNEWICGNCRTVHAITESPTESLALPRCRRCAGFLEPYDGFRVRDLEAQITRLRRIATEAIEVASHIGLILDGSETHALQTKTNRLRQELEGNT